MRHNSQRPSPGIRISLMVGIVLAAIGNIDLSSAFAQRYVVVNGQVLAETTVERLERLGCVSIPSGRYWLLKDGSWGYEGDLARRGRLGDNCQRRKSLSERGLLYYPGELLRDY